MIIVKNPYAKENWKLMFSCLVSSMYMGEYDGRPKFCHKSVSLGLMALP